MAVLGVVCRVEQDTSLLGLSPDRRMELALFGALERSDCEKRTVEIAVAVLASMQGDCPFGSELLEWPGRSARDDRHARAGVAEPLHLGFGERPTTDHDGDTTAEIEGNRIVVLRGHASR